VTACHSFSCDPFGVLEQRAGGVVEIGCQSSFEQRLSPLCKSSAFMELRGVAIRSGYRRVKCGASRSPRGRTHAACIHSQRVFATRNTVESSHGDLSGIASPILTEDAISLQSQTLHLSCDLAGGANYSGGSVSVSFVTGTGTDEVFNFNSGFATGNVQTNFGTATPAAGIAAHADFGTVQLPFDETEAALRFTWTPSGTAGADDSLSFTNRNLTASAGDVPFVHKRYAAALALAQYTYRKTFAYGTAPAQNPGTGTGEFTFAAPVAGANSERVHVSFGDAMRAAPAVTFFNPAAANGNARDETAAADCTSPTASNITEKGFDFVCTGAAGTVAGNKIGFHYTADARHCSDPIVRELGACSPERRWPQCYGYFIRLPSQNAWSPVARLVMHR
jgi:hypothetical protein